MVLTVSNLGQGELTGCFTFSWLPHVPMLLLDWLRVANIGWSQLGPSSVSCGLSFSSSPARPPALGVQKKNKNVHRLLEAWSGTMSFLPHSVDPVKAHSHLRYKDQEILWPLDMQSSRGTLQRVMDTGRGITVTIFAINLPHPLFPFLHFKSSSTLSCYLYLWCLSLYFPQL